MSDQPQNPPSPTPPPVPAEPVMDAETKKYRLVAALSYLGLLFLVPLLTAKESDYAKFHVRQGIVLYAVQVVVSFLIWIPYLGWLLAVVTAIVMLYATIQAYNGHRWELPWLGQYAKEITL